jgi:hypothetical protein
MTKRIKFQGFCNSAKLPTFRKLPDFQQLFLVLTIQFITEDKQKHTRNNFKINEELRQVENSRSLYILHNLQNSHSLGTGVFAIFQQQAVSFIVALVFIKLFCSFKPFFINCLTLRH